MTCFNYIKQIGIFAFINFVIGIYEKKGNTKIWITEEMITIIYKSNRKNG